MGLKDKGDVFDVQSTNPLNVFPIQDTYAIKSGIKESGIRLGWFMVNQSTKECIVNLFPLLL